MIGVSDVADIDDPTHDWIRQLPIGVPSAWRAVAGPSLRGVRGVGFEVDSELLLVEWTDGKSIVDCVTGQRVAHDPEAAITPDEEVRLESHGVGPLAEKIVRVCGLFGGGLPLMTLDGWTVELVHHHWPHLASVVLVPRGLSIWEPTQIRHCFKLAETEAPRACGFSHTGQSLILARGHILQIWTRAQSG